MALNLYDRVKETCLAPGTGAVTLLGAVTGFQSFAIVGNANTCYYTIADQYGANWEVGIGTYTLSGTTLARTTVLSSSAGGTTKANFSSGTQDVFVTYPAEKAFSTDMILNVVNGGTGLTSLTVGYIPYGNGTSALSTSSNLFFNGYSLGIGTTSPVSGGFGSGVTVNVPTGQGARLDMQVNGASKLAFTADANWITFDANSPYRYYYNGTQVMTLFASGGLSLGNTTDPGAGNLRFNTTNSNGIYFGSSSLLTDYETGTFTPNIVFGGGNTGITGSFLGSYTKIGRLVQFNIFITLSNKGSSTGGATILGLPYTSNSATPTSIIMDAQFLTYTGNYLLAYNPASASSLDLYQVSTASTTQLTNTAFANNTVLRIAGTYFV